MPADPGDLQSWQPLVVLGTGFIAVVAALAVAGRRTGNQGPSGPIPGGGEREDSDWLLWIPRGLERATGIPGWAAAMVGTASFGLLLAGIGFYNDVAWHVGIGRDEELFTAPHTMIVLGLQLIIVAGAVGVLFATLDRRPGALRFRGLHVPRSAAAMVLIGAAAVSGFPLDELWHRQFGIDVTMWSPTHLLMIVGASLTPVVSWLALAEAGVRPSDSWRVRAVHLVVGVLLLDGLSSVQGEFDFGVPQFQQLYAPVLVAVAAGMALAAVRVAHGPGWTFAVAGFMYLTRMNLGAEAGSLDLDVRPTAVYLGAALAVELAAWLFGTDRRLRFALAAGAGVGTLGLAVEWAWNQGAHQPWTPALLPDALVLALVAASAAAVLGVALGDVARLRPVAVPGRSLVAAGLVLVFALAWPFPRTTSDVTAVVALERLGDGTAWVRAQTSPAGAAEDARWFQASAWQGGGLVVADMEETAPGVWRSERPVPVTSPWKTLLRLHRGSDMMAIPLYLPADPEVEGIRGEAVPAIDKTAPFEKESRYLLREQTGGSAFFAWAIPGLVLGLAAAVLGSFVYVISSMRRSATRAHSAVSSSTTTRLTG